MKTAAAASSPAPLATKPRGATTNFTLLGADAAPHFHCVALRDAAVADGAAPRAALVLARLLAAVDDRRGEARGHGAGHVVAKGEVGVARLVRERRAVDVAVARGELVGHVAAGSLLIDYAVSRRARSRTPTCTS